jgi:signal transduction histidine kinase/CHASE3 domain sensor protein
MIVAALALATTVAAAFAILLSAVQDQAVATRDEGRSERILYALHDLERTVLNLETGQRGFVITGDERFLAPWDESRRAYPVLSRRLEALIASFDRARLPAARRLTDDVRAYAEEWSARVVRAARTDPAQARALVAGGEGRRRVDGMRAAFARFERAERLLSVERQRRAADAERRADLFGLLGLAGSALLILLFASYFVRTIVLPVRRLAGTTARLAAGDLSARAPESGAGELAGLGRDLNAMAASLEAGQARLESQNAELAAVLDATVDGICMVDLDGRVVFANAAMDRLWADFGIPAEGPIWDRIARLARMTTNADEYLATFAEVAGDPERSFWDEFRIVGSDRSYIGFTGPVHDSLGTLLGRIFTCREVTAERESERLKDEFVATVSHELRTPLTSIIGYLELVLAGEAGELSPEQERFLTVADRNAARLLRLVGDLLFVAQLEAGKLGLEPEEIALAELVAESVAEKRPLAQDRGLDLALQTARVGPLWADRARIVQVLDNLLSNAVKFTQPGGRIVVRVREEERRAVIEVADTGIGIPELEREQLFQRFFRASGASDRAIPGSGLGLAITKAIVEAHGGTISVDSVEGHGSTFRVELPLSAARVDVAA